MGGHGTDEQQSKSYTETPTFVHSAIKASLLHVLSLYAIIHKQFSEENFLYSVF